MRIVADDAPALLAELSHEAAVLGVEASGRGIVARGRGVVELASAVARAVVRAGVELELMRVDAPAMEALRVPAAPHAGARGGPPRQPPPGGSTPAAGSLPPTSVGPGPGLTGPPPPVRATTEDR